MKKLLTLVLSVIMVCGMFASCTYAEEQSLYQYKVKADGTAEITGISDTSLEIMDIPAELDGYKVTSIGIFAFGSCSRVLSVTIPEGITAVNPDAFANSFMLESVTIPDSLVFIGQSAFRSKKLTEIHLSPDHPVFAVENEALIDKQNMTLVQFLAPELTGTYVISPGIKTVGASAFEFGRISSVLIPDSVTSIEIRAFDNCTDLKSINIPDSVTQIGNNIFYHCTNLTSIQISPDHPVYECIDLTIADKQSKKIIAASGAINGKYVIPEGIRAIDDFVFQGCAYLDALLIPDTVTEMGNYVCGNDTVIMACSGSAAQEYCAAAEGVRFTEMSPEEFSEAVETLKQEKASGTQPVKTKYSWRIDDDTLVSGDYYYHIKADDTAEITAVNEFITDGNIPAELDGHKVTSIHGDAFYSCSSLEKIVIPEGVNSLGYYSFMSCPRLESVTIPDSLNYIDRTPFDNCPKLKTIVISPDHPVYAIDNGALINKKEMTMIYFLDHGNTGTYEVPQGIRMLADDLFSGSGYSSIILPDSVSVIGSHAFSHCMNLTEMVLPEGVTSIGSQAFFGCDNLESLTIPDSLTYIGSAVFGYNPALTSVHISPDHPVYEMLDNLLVNKQDMRIVSALNNTPAKYTLPEGIQQLGFMAFQGSSNLTELVVPEGVTKIGVSAFSGCSKLEKVTLPSSVTEIADNAFEYSHDLTIMAPAGSYAQQYSQEKGYKFIAIDP